MEKSPMTTKVSIGRNCSHFTYLQSEASFLETARLACIHPTKHSLAFWVCFHAVIGRR
jgi:hypothetical protein